MVTASLREVNSVLPADPEAPSHAQPQATTRALDQLRAGRIRRP